MRGGGKDRSRSIRREVEKRRGGEERRRRGVYPWSGCAS